MLLQPSIRLAFLRACQVSAFIASLACSNALARYLSSCTQVGSGPVEPRSLLVYFTPWLVFGLLWSEGGSFFGQSGNRFSNVTTTPFKTSAPGLFAGGFFCRPLLEFLCVTITPFEASCLVWFAGCCRLKNDESRRSDSQVSEANIISITSHLILNVRSVSLFSLPICYFYASTGFLCFRCFCWPLEFFIRSSTPFS